MNIRNDPGGQSKSAAFEFDDPNSIDLAVTGLNGITLGDSKLFVQKVPSSMGAALLIPSSQNNPPISTPTLSMDHQPTVANENSKPNDFDVLKDHNPTTVLRLSNMVTLEDLLDNDLYEDLIEDIANECNNHGTVKTIIVPRPNKEVAKDIPLSTSGQALKAMGEEIGMIFVQFTHEDGAIKAKKAVSGRTFNGNNVVAHFYPDELFLAKVF